MKSPIEAYGLTEATAIYVTRPFGRNGITYQITLSIWMQLLVVFLVWLNIVGWSVYGLYELGSKVVG